MLESELDGWAKYAQRHSLPFRRLEIMLAQVCKLIAQTMGGAKNVNVSDFMLAVPEERPNNVTRLEEVRAAFGFKPRKPKA